MKIIMNIQIKQPERKEVVEPFPAVLQEIQHNYQTFQQGLAEVDEQNLTTEDMTELAPARKYTRCVRVAYLLGKNTWKILCTQRTPIDDKSPFPALLVGVSSYAANRFREIKHSGPYIYSGKPNKLEITDRIIQGFDIGVSKLLDTRIKDQEKIQQLDLQGTMLDEFKDLEDRLQFIWYLTRRLNLFEHIMYCLNSDDSPEIYQGLCDGVASFLEKVAAEYADFRTQHKM